MKPWGAVDWLVPKVSNGPWHFITSSSFEDRSIACADWIVRSNIPISGAFVLKISNPPSEWWDEGSARVEVNLDQIRRILGGHQAKIFDCQLTAMPSWIRDAQGFIPAEPASVILDITTLPKRIFMFAVRELLNRQTVQDLIVTYARAQVYPEAQLCRDALPITALPGFMRTNVEKTNRRRIIVGIGYTGLGVEELVQSGRETKIDFVFPFPPGSPAFRRNWGLLARLMPIDLALDVHRVHSLDAFEVCNRLLGWSREFDVEVVPLGPKPHALGACMAYIRSQGAIELIYAQPQAYFPRYSEGLAIDHRGELDITGYCLKRNGALCF